MGKLEIARTANRPRPNNNRQSTQNRESNSQLAFNLSAKVIILLHLRAFSFHVFTFRYAFFLLSGLILLSISLAFPPPRAVFRATLCLATADIMRCSTLYSSTDWTSIHFLGATPFLLCWSSPCAAKSRNTENQTRWLLYIIPLIQNKTRQLLHETPRLFAKTSGLSKTLPPLIMYFPLL